MSRFHANYRASSGRQSDFNDTFTFGAANEGAAETIALLVDAITEGKRVSLTKSIQTFHLGAAHPAGTRQTATAIAADATEAIWKFRLRNFKLAATEEGLTALVMGTAHADPGGVVAALSAAPKIPATGSPITVVRNVSIITKS